MNVRMSLNGFLTRLIWLCVGPLVLLAAYLAIDSVMTAQADRDLEAANLAKNFATAIDQDLNARIGALHMLAVSPLVDDASSWKDLYQEAQGFRQSFGSHVVFADVGMRMLFNTRVPFGTALPPLPRPKGHAAAPTAVETGKPAVGDTFFGPIAREPLVAIAVPARREEKTAFLLLAIFETRQFQDRLDQVALPSGWSLALLDGKDEVIARRAPPGLNPATDVDAAGRFVVKSAVSPWSVVLEIPRGIYREPLFAAAAALAIAILGATLAGVVGGMLASRRLGSLVASLAQTPAPGAPPPDITEIATVRRLLDESAEQRETAEAARRESEQRFRATFEQAAVGIALVAPDGRWLRANQKLCDIVGYSHDELLTMTFQDITHPEDLDAELGRVRQMLAGETETYAMEKRYLRKGGAIVWINLTVALARKADGSPDYFILVVEDIQRRKEAEEEIHRLNTSLEQRVELRTAELTAANQELDSFAYAVSHDLRAPLRAMGGFSRALVEDYGDRLGGEAKIYLDQIGIASRKMGELIEGILVLSRSARGDLRRDTVDLSALAASLLAGLARAEPGRAVAIDIEPGLTVHGDARMIEVVMENLLGNAWKYTARTPVPSIRVFTGELDGQRGICVADNGAGFDMAHADRLFQPFRRLHREDEFPGIGIGLATVQRIIRRHGGEIRAHSAPGEGATFRFTLAGESEVA